MHVLIKEGSKMKINYQGNRHAGVRFARTSREAYGHPVTFKKPRNPDAPVVWACAIAACVLTYLILAGLV